MNEERTECFTHHYDLHFCDIEIHMYCKSKTRDIWKKYISELFLKTQCLNKPISCLVGWFGKSKEEIKRPFCLLCINHSQKLKYHQHTIYFCTNKIKL
jgi:hypothetical protein